MKPLLRSKMDIEKYRSNSSDIDSVLRENFDKLNVAIRENGVDVDTLYFKNRLMLDKEYIEILLQIKDIKPQKIYISSSALDSVCTGSVMPGLYNFCDKIPMCIVYDENDYKSKMSAQSISSAKKKINMIKDSELSKTQIILYPHCVITVEYVPHFIAGSYILRVTILLLHCIRSIYMPRGRVSNSKLKTLLKKHVTYPPFLQAFLNSHLRYLKNHHFSICDISFSYDSLLKYPKAPDSKILPKKYPNS